MTDLTDLQAVQARHRVVFSEALALIEDLPPLWEEKLALLTGELDTLHKAELRLGNPAPKVTSAHIMKEE